MVRYCSKTADFDLPYLYLVSVGVIPFEFHHRSKKLESVDYPIALFP